MNVARFALGVEVYAKPEIIGVEDIFQRIPPSCRRQTRIPNSGTHHILFTHLFCLQFQSFAELEYRAPGQNTHIFGTHFGYCYVYDLRNVWSAASLLRAKEYSVYPRTPATPNILLNPPYLSKCSEPLGICWKLWCCQKYTVCPRTLHNPNIFPSLFLKSEILHI